MKKSHAAGLGSDYPTPAQLKEFFSQIAAGKFPQPRMQSILGGNDLKLSKKYTFDDFRKIKGLLVVGPEEWEMATRRQNGRNRDPLGLGRNWCPRDILMVIDTSRGHLELTPEIMQVLVELCKTPKWDCTPVLQLELPEVGGESTSLAWQYKCWGVPHEGMTDGVIRQDEQYPSEPIRNKAECAFEPATEKVRVVVKYLDFPEWTTGKSWGSQKAEIKERGLETVSVSSDALTMSLVSIALGKQFRNFNSLARTDTMFDSHPLSINRKEGALRCSTGSSSWGYSGNDLYFLGAAVRGIPSEIVSQFI